jgi:hypothetical protein
MAKKMASTPQRPSSVPFPPRFSQLNRIVRRMSRRAWETEFMPDMPRPVSHGFYTRLAPEAALNTAAQHFREHGRHVTDPREPCPRRYGKLDGLHFHVPGTLEVDGNIVRSLLKIRLYEVGTRGFKFGGTTLIQMELAIDRSHFGDGQSARRQAEIRGDADFQDLSFAFELAEMLNKISQPSPGIDL